MIGMFEMRGISQIIVSNDLLSNENQNKDSLEEFYENTKTHYVHKYIRIDVLVNQDKLFSIHVTILRTIWLLYRPPMHI